MARGEGIWYHAGKMYIVDTATGRDSAGRPGRGEGAVWVLDLGTMRLEALFVSGAALAANNPDNIAVSPRGGVVLCEHAGGVSFGFGRAPAGAHAGRPVVCLLQEQHHDLRSGHRDAGKSVAAGDYRDNEFAGACFDRRGQVMFFNIQTPGVTFAVWGPRAKGNL